MMAKTASPRLLTLPDIAALAGVQRAVVSMWRNRTSVRGAVVPFPAAVDVVGKVEHFALDDIVAYLAATGRGKNPEAAVDAATLAAPVAAGHESAELLLSLAVLTGADLASLSPAELVTLAEEVDQNDQFLLREAREQSWHPDLPGHVDELVAASFGAEDAFARLDSGRLARGAGHRGCAPELVSLVASVTAACRDHAGTGAVLDASGDLQFDQALAPHFPAVLINDSAGVSARRLRRRAAALQWAVLPEPGSVPIVRVRSLLGMATDDALLSADDVVVSLGPGDVAVVLGPATALTDALVGSAERARAETLRPGPLATALRLPRGLWKAAHRQSSAVWVLTQGTGRTEARLADLDGVDLDLDDLAADVAQALAPLTTSGPLPTEARTYRYLRPRALDRVLAGGQLVPRGTRAVRLHTADEHLETTHSAARELERPLPPLDTSVAACHALPVVRWLSLGELVNDKRLVLRQGRRIDPAGADPRGTVHVLSADGADADLRLDPFYARDRYARATWTEPGDVVFIEKPRPRAIVDTRGGSLVATPSRILRLADSAPVGPHVLAERINRSVPGSEWRTWDVPALSRADAEALDARLAEVASYRDELLRRERALDTWASALVAGVAAGSLALPSTHQQTASAENR
ncbi:hypothetical protein FHU33_3799 [Blastococcus colisei]|uniref:Uncharacterized protein n=1 Tax=Blastococcus colisei TaxID=1564162 RepID=A0A543PJR1_9ACTN|nr:hypothetical protein FHU33_3799 [Blastococcus colisei]